MVIRPVPEETAAVVSEGSEKAKVLLALGPYFEVAVVPPPDFCRLLKDSLNGTELLAVNC